MFQTKFINTLYIYILPLRSQSNHVEHEMILITLIHSTVQVKILHYLLSFIFAFSIENKKSTKFRYKRGKIWEKKKKKKL